MATHNKSLQLIALKLGLGDEEKVLRKAAEFERLLQTKTIAGSNMTDTSKVVICLDLAAFLLGVELDTKTAIKYSGLKPSTYNNCRKVVENLLEINNDQLTIPGLCVMLQCSGVQALAGNILEEYRKQAKMEIDLNLPQYVCMAVHQACRLNKVKVSKTKLMEKSRLKPAQWGKMEADWTTFVNGNFASAIKKRGRPPKCTAVTDETETTEVEKCSIEESTKEPEMEPYDEWKKRMLEKAYKEFMELQKNQQENVKKQRIEKPEETMLCPRKNNVITSPRKNSQLISPRKGSQRLSKREDSQTVSPRKDSQLLSPRKDKQLLSIRSISQNLSPTKNDQRTSPRKLRVSIVKDKELMSPRNVRLSITKDSQHLLPGKDTQFVSLRKNSELLSPRKDSEQLLKDPLSLSPMEECVSPRRSPRKTPQKFSPYKSPNVTRGVRLLFPKNL